jgi:hypothetical protein
MTTNLLCGTAGGGAGPSAAPRAWIGGLTVRDDGPWRGDGRTAASVRSPTRLLLALRRGEIDRALGHVGRLIRGLRAAGIDVAALEGADLVKRVDGDVLLRPMAGVSAGSPVAMGGRFERWGS